MRRTLSSLQTTPIKIFLPIIWIILSFIASRLLFFTQSTDASERRIFLFVCAVLTASVWDALRLKVISIDDRNIYILNYTKEISIPLSEILNVTQNRWQRGEHVTIHLQSQSEFGCKIRFLPKVRFFAFGQHPVVRELKALARNAQAVHPNVG